MQSWSALVRGLGGNTKELSACMPAPARPLRYTVAPLQLDTLLLLSYLVPDAGWRGVLVGHFFRNGGRRYLPRLAASNMARSQARPFCAQAHRHDSHKHSRAQSSTVKHSRAQSNTQLCGCRVSRGVGMPLPVSFSVGMEQQLKFLYINIDANCVTSVNHPGPEWPD